MLNQLKTYAYPFSTPRDPFFPEKLRVDRDRNINCALPVATVPEQKNTLNAPSGS